MPGNRKEAKAGEEYWLFQPKSCPAYREMLIRKEVKEVPKDLSEMPLSTLVAVKGIKSSDDLIDFLGALLADLTVGSVGHEDAMACLSVADKIVEVARFSLAQPASKALGSSRPLTLPGRE